MKSIKTRLLFLVIAGLSFSCSKSSGDSGPACESNETTKVTFKNNGSTALRVEVALSFNAMFEPNSPVVAIDLAAGASSVKEFRYGRYFVQWKNGCPAACSQRAFYAKDFAICQEYQETQ